MRRSLACLAVSLAACSSGGGTVQFTASGEVLALGGYAFPPTSADAPAFVDGWELRFDKVLVTIDKVTLSEAPDTAPADQSRAGKVVASVDGPWAIDLHKGGPIAGKGGSDEEALVIATLTGQNRNSDEPFDPTVRYAFGYDLIAASANAKRLNLDADDPDYAEMIDNGYVVYYLGHASWKGRDCKSTNNSFDFTALPTTVHFRLGFRSPTRYVNCQNPDNDPARALGDEEHQRGIQIKDTGTTVAQVTVHTDHPFWQTIVHESPAHFDPYAALAKSVGGESVVSLEDTIGVDYTAFRAGTLALPWRSCTESYAPPNTAPQMGYDSLGVPHNPSGSPTTTLRDFADYLTYNQSTQGHLNSDGLCFVQRNYPSPP